MSQRTLSSLERLRELSARAPNDEAARQRALRALPQVQKILDMPAARALAATHARPAIRSAVREELASLRRRILDQDFAGNILEAPALRHNGRDGDALLKVPVIRMVAQTEVELNRRAGRLRRRLAALPELDLRIERGTTYAGGGALPGVSLPTRLISIGARDIGAEPLARKLRDGRPPLVGRIAQDRLLLDMRTMADSELGAVVAAFRGVLA